MAKGFTQKEGVYYENNFSPIAKVGYHMDILCHRNSKSWKFHQMDVKISFLNGDMKENVFVSQPEGFFVKV